MKEETKELVKFIKQQMNCVKEEAIKQNAQSQWWFSAYDKAINFLDSLPEIESRLCRGGYIQDRNGTPCCHGDKVRFKFIDKWYEEDFKDRYPIVMDGILKFCKETKAFYIQFGPDHNGYDWLDWTCDSSGCEWFEKVEK